MRGADTVADDLRMTFNDLLRKTELTDADFLREGVRVLARAVMEQEVHQHVGAERYERSPDRRGERNGYRDRQRDTRVGTVELAVPPVPDCSFFPTLRSRAGGRGGR
jgi:transposase-like protein